MKELFNGYKQGTFGYDIVKESPKYIYVEHVSFSTERDSETRRYDKSEKDELLRVAEENGFIPFDIFPGKLVKREAVR